MSEVALMVKKRLNEAYESSALKKFIAFAQSLAKKNNKYYEIHFIKNGKNYDVINVRYDGTLYNGIYKNCLSDLTDDNIYGKKFYEHDDLTKVLKGKTPSWKNLKQSTTGRKISCVVLVDWEEVKKSDNAEALAGLFIEENGTRQILASIQKNIDRGKEKIVKIDTSNDPRKWTAAKWKDVFANIKNDYTKFKKERGDKAALELSETVNKLSGNDNVLAAMSKLFGYRIEKDTAVRFLYVFLLDGKHYEWLNPMFKDDRFVKLFKKYNPNKEV
jgi:hypothetical protein